MPSIYQLKPAFQKLIRPIAGFLARLGVSANFVTSATCILSAGVGAFIWFSDASKVSLIIFAFFLLFRMGLNAIDGILAREHGMKSKLGMLLNELTDVIEDGLLYLPLVKALPIYAAYIVIIVTLGIISEMAGVTGTMIGASRRYDGPMGKSDRAGFFATVALVLVFWPSIGQAPWLCYVLQIALLLSIITISNRVRYSLQEAK